MSTRIFISSVQKEFEPDRAELAKFIAGDPLLGKQFDTFLFERDVPATGQRPDAVYLDELGKSTIYLGLFGNEYGWENENGLSPTHVEFTEATRLGIPRLIYVKGANDSKKHPKMRALIQEAGNQVIRRRFNSFAELRSAVYSSLIHYLEHTGVIQAAPWDASPAGKATLDDLDADAIGSFVSRARKARNFPVPETADTEEVLSHLNLLDEGKPTNACVLLFARHPQRFLLPSEVKCAHFHGTEVAKPIPSYQVYKGTAFQLVDQAVDFVLSKINVSVGTRAESAAAPVTYEIPREVVREAIVNAVAHRDYTSNASVQVMLFADRLEVWNPGGLPPNLTLEKLRKRHGSFPHNPLLAEPLYLAQYIERLGTGTRDMIRLCQKAGLPEPDFQLTDGFLTIIRRPTNATSRDKLQPESGLELGLESIAGRILAALEGGPLAKAGLARALGHKSISSKLNIRVNQLLEAGLIEPTIPEKPNSRLQKYRLTAKGRILLKSEK